MTTDRAQSVITRLHGVRSVGNAKWEARCPAHDDAHASLSVANGDDGRVVIHCHAGCDTLSVLRAAGLSWADVFPPRQFKADSGPKGRVVATYDYHDRDGNLLYQSVRFEPKDFRQRRPDGRGNWIWNLENTPRVLYHLPELAAADAGRNVWIVEGEKDVETLRSHDLLATCNPGGAGKWHRLSDYSVLYGRPIIIVPDADEAGAKHAAQVASHLGSRCDVRILNLPGPGKDVTDYFNAGGSLEQLMELARAVQAAPAESRRRIQVDTELHRVVEECVEALLQDDALYQRGRVLVRVLRAETDANGILRPASSPMIDRVPKSNLTERLTRHAAFWKLNKDGDEIPTVPSERVVGMVHERCDYPGIRPLNGLSDAPVVRPDGSIHQTPGYDARTGVLYEPPDNLSFPAIADGINIDDADAALLTLLDAVCDFPFESEEHKSAWLAALLTPLARFAFSGPAPLFLIDANVRGAGKGLLAQTIGRIVLGREMPVSSYAHESEELRKKVTAITVAGDRMVLFDNLEGPFGNDVLDRVLTGTVWKDRLLGENREVELPIHTVWYATGNNVQVAADTIRRTIHVRLDCLDERPEERRGFRHTNLLAWIDANRGQLLAGALTILSAYIQSGRPTHNLRPFGSFEGWSELVREAVVWVGLPDPCLTRVRLAATADTSTDALGQLMMAWRKYDWMNQGIVINELIRDLYPANRSAWPNNDESVVMRAAIENLIGLKHGEAPRAKQITARLKSFRRRVMNGVFLDIDPAYNRLGAIWKVVDGNQANGDVHAS